jgi:glycosyltransferase 2 family protein
VKVPAADDGSMMTHKTIISLVVAVSASLFGLYFAFRNIPFVELFRYLKSINYFWAIPAMAAVTGCFVLRALRWRIILTASSKIRFMEAFHPLMIGFMINCVLPGRAGEIARPFIIKKKSGIPFSTGVATVAVERVFDMLILIGCLTWMLTVVDFSSHPDTVFGQYHLNRATLAKIGENLICLSILLVAAISIISVSSCRRLIVKGIITFSGRLSFLGPKAEHFLKNRLSKGLVDLLENFSEGFSLMKSPAKILSCMGLSIAIWCLQAYSYYLMSYGCPGICLSYIDIFFVMVIICFFIALPSVPGYWGLWEAGGVFALALFGIDAKDAAGFTLANHAIQILPVIGIGIISAASISVNIRQFQPAKTQGVK